MITMTEIAKLTGVSQATVSRVLNGNNAVNEATKHKVLDCAKEHNYQPNIMAQSLVGSKTFLLGLVVTDISNPFFADLVRAIEKAAGDNGYSLMLFDTDYNMEKEEKYFSILSRYKVDGIITVPITDNKEYVKKLKSYDLPMVSVTMDLDTIDSVYVSHFDAGKKVAAHMLGVGYDSFIFIGGENDQKGYGFAEELSDKDIDIKNHYLCIVMRKEDNLSPQQQDQKLKETLQQRIIEEKHRSGIGIFANNDIQALKVLEILKELKIKIPEEAAVVGFDNTYLCKITSPTLTSVSQPIDEIARLAIERMMEIIRHKTADCVRYQLETRVVTRESTIKMKKKVTRKL